MFTVATVLNALELGFIYALVAMALFLSFRVLNIADMTTDGAFTLGCAVSATAAVAGHPFLGLPLAMLAGVAAVVFDVVINMAWPILKKKRWLPIAVMLAAFLATRFFSVNIILIILVCGVIGALDTLYLQKREDDK